ncbi:MAG TPA: TetR/AcrR family transcriptional regulator [Spirochaetota bacterium]|nr:TetR/AcrR family transcriptional regulator [Spirochaetota bacterium]
MKNENTQPPGKIKIAEAMRALLSKKSFNEITTAEIARLAGVTEALIYKYYKDKRDLLHQILTEYMKRYLLEGQKEMLGISGALKKLEKSIWTHINVYATNRVFARILLLEVRSFPDYYRSRSYKLVKEYSDILLEIIEEGMKNGEIRKDVSPSFLRQVILGSIEHVCLTDVVFDREINPDQRTEDLCRFIFQGISGRKRK